MCICGYAGCDVCCLRYLFDTHQRPEVVVANTNSVCFYCCSWFYIGNWRCRLCPVTQHYNCHSFGGSVERTSVTYQLISHVTLFLVLHPFVLYFQLIPLHLFNVLLVLFICELDHKLHLIVWWAALAEHDHGERTSTMRMRGYIKYTQPKRKPWGRMCIHWALCCMGELNWRCVWCLVHIASMQCCSLWPLLCSDGRIHSIWLQLTLDSCPSLWQYTPLSLLKVGGRWSYNLLEMPIGLCNTTLLCPNSWKIKKLGREMKCKLEKGMCCVWTCTNSVCFCCCSWF